jgi:hypothetical protein
MRALDVHCVLTPHPWAERRCPERHQLFFQSLVQLRLSAWLPPQHPLHPPTDHRVATTLQLFHPHLIHHGNCSEQLPVMSTAHPNCPLARTHSTPRQVGAGAHNTTAFKTLTPSRPHLPSPSPLPLAGSHDAASLRSRHGRRFDIDGVPVDDADLWQPAQVYLPSAQSG